MITLIDGLPGSGKTEFCIEWMRRMQASHANSAVRNKTIWITPQRLTHQSIIKSLVSQSQTCFWKPRILTFDQLAEQILNSSVNETEMVSQSQRSMLIRQIINRLVSANKLDHFRSIAETPGFRRQVLQQIDELKQLEIWPDHFDNVVEQHFNSQKNHELSLIYHDYQQALLKHHLYDQHGRFWLARTTFQQSPAELLPYHHLIIDGFADFTPTQYELIGLLTARMNASVITLPITLDDARHDLVAKPKNAWGKLQSIFKENGNPVERKTLQSSSTQRASGMHQVIHQLFDDEVSTDDSLQSGSEGVRIQRFMGIRSEVREVGRQVKQLLQNGVHPEQILIGARDRLSIAAELEQIWSDAKLPFLLEREHPFSSHPLVQLMSLIVQVELENWSIPLLTRLLQHTLVQEDESEHTEHEMISRIQITKYLKSLTYLRSRTSLLQSIESQLARDDLDDLMSQRIDATFQFLSGLNSHLEKLRSPQSITGFVEHLIDVVHDLLVSPEQLTEFMTPEDRWMWSAETLSLILDQLRSTASFEDSLDPQSGHCSLAEFHHWWKEVIQNEVIPVHTSSEGKVRVLDAMQIRSLNADYLFLMNLQEGTFPLQAGYESLYGDAERQHLAEHGLPLRTRESHHQEEMQFFYRVVTAARKQLTLSYAIASNQGTPQYPSSYLLAVESLFPEDSFSSQPHGQLSPVPSEYELLTQTDVRLQAAQQMTAGHANQFRWLMENQPTQKMTQSYLAAARMNAVRFYEPGYSAYEGVTQQGPIQDRLSMQFSESREFSATQLEQYATCPFRFLLNNLLEIEPAESSELDANYLQRGILTHSFLAQLHERYPNYHPTLADEFQHEFQQLIEQKFSQTSRQGLLAVLDQLEKRLILQWADAYTDQLSDYLSTLSAWDQAPESRFLEWDFGSPPAADQQSPSSPPLVLGTGETPIKVQGRIDRIDYGVVDGEPVFSIIDYKTGSVPQFKTSELKQGTHLQLMLYLIAVTRSNLFDQEAKPFQIGYWSLKKSGYQIGMTGKGIKADKALEASLITELTDLLDCLVPRLVQGLRAGEFPVYSPQQDCTSRCAFRTTCRVNQIRSLPEGLNKRWEWLSE